jgi:hypothetical protein
LEYWSDGENGVLEWWSNGVMDSRKRKMGFGFSLAGIMEHEKK